MVMVEPGSFWETWPAHGFTLVSREKASGFAINLFLTCGKIQAQKFKVELEPPAVPGAQLH